MSRRLVLVVTHLCALAAGYVAWHRPVPAPEPRHRDPVEVLVVEQGAVFPVQGPLSPGRRGSPRDGLLRIDVHGERGTETVWVPVPALKP